MNEVVLVILFIVSTALIKVGLDLLKSPSPLVQQTAACLLGGGILLVIGVFVAALFNKKP